MVQISGKYVHTHSVNFVESVIAQGIPEDIAKNIDSEKKLEVKLDGNNVTLITENRTYNYVLDKEILETGRDNKQYQTTVSLSGSTLTIVSKFPGGKVYKKDLVFNDTGAEMVIDNGKRIFKRV